jgi:hypothetical protein
MPSIKANLTRDTLRKIASSTSSGSVKQKLAELRLAYSQDHKLLTGYINNLVNVNRIFPRHLPTQASFRWSTMSPPITNWPRACINPACVQDEHEWTEQCWSVRDILLPDDDEVLISWDHDNIEGRIHDLIVNDQTALQAHADGLDLHTMTCCDIFSYQYPTDLRNPHSSDVDSAWRQRYAWQGKDTKQRVLAKNFNHGSKYSKTWRFVYRIQGIEKYGVTRDNLGKLARVYIASKGNAWQRKLDIMESIRKNRIARTLYGGRRIFYDSSDETAREGLSHMISGTVSDYNNITLELLEQMLGDSCRLLHNCHDGNKLAVKKDNVPTVDELRAIIERELSYEDRTLTMTAGIKVHDVH